MNTRPGLRIQLAVSHIFFLLVILIALGFYWISAQTTSPLELLQAGLGERVAKLSKQSASGSSAIPISIDHLAFDRTVRTVVVHPDFSLSVLSESSITEPQRALAVETSRELFATSSLPNGYTQTYQVYDTLYAAAPLLDPGNKPAGVVCLILPLPEFRQAAAQSRSIFLAAAAAATLLGLVLAIWVSRLLIKPLALAGKVLARVSQGDTNWRLPETGPREITELARNINAMAGALEKQQVERRLVLANTTHELARPLGALRLGVDSLRTGALTDPELAGDLLNEMDQTLQRMEALIDDLSLAARPAGRPVVIDAQCIPVEPLLKGLRSRFWQRAEARSIELQAQVQPGTPSVLADEIRLNQILSNLIDNSLKYTPVGGCITLTACGCRQGVQFQILDSGPGIPEQDLEHVFEPFFQVEKTKGVHQGMGLGLSIVRQLVIAQSGTVELSNLPEGGLKVVVILPACE
jgi:histidine kinase